MITLSGVYSLLLLSMDTMRRHAPVVHSLGIPCPESTTAQHPDLSYSQKDGYRPYSYKSLSCFITLPHSPPSSHILWAVHHPTPSISSVRSASITSTSTGLWAKALLARRVPLLICYLSFSNPRIQVRVVEHKRSKKLYALKYIDKHRCIKQKSVTNVIQERRLLEEVRHSPPPLASLIHLSSTGQSSLLGQPPLCFPR